MGNEEIIVLALGYALVGFFGGCVLLLWKLNHKYQESLKTVLEDFKNRLRLEFSYSFGEETEDFTKPLHLTISFHRIKAKKNQ